MAVLHNNRKYREGFSPEDFRKETEEARTISESIFRSIPFSKKYDPAEALRLLRLEKRSTELEEQIIKDVFQDTVDFDEVVVPGVARRSLTVSVENAYYYRGVRIDSKSEVNGETLNDVRADVIDAFEKLGLGDWRDSLIVGIDKGDAETLLDGDTLISTQISEPTRLNFVYIFIGLDVTTKSTSDLGNAIRAIEEVAKKAEDKYEKQSYAFEQD